MGHPEATDVRQGHGQGANEDDHDRRGREMPCLEALERVKSCRGRPGDRGVDGARDSRWRGPVESRVERRRKAVVVPVVVLGHRARSSAASAA